FTQFASEGYESTLYTEPFPEGGTPTPVGDIIDAGALSWSRTAGDDRLVYAGGVEGTDLYVVDPLAASPTPEFLVGDGDDPSWGTDGRIAFRRGANVYTVRSDGTDETPVSETGSDYDPSLAGRELALSRLISAGDEE